MYTLKFFLMAACCLSIGLYAGFHVGERKSATQYQRAAIDHGFAYHNPYDGKWEWVDMEKAQEEVSKTLPKGIFINNLPVTQRKPKVK